MYCLNSRLALHHRHAARRPTEDEVGIEALGGHGVISSARRVIHGQHDLRDPRRRHRFDEARAGPNDSFVLGLWSHHETRDVLNEQQRNALAVAAIDEIRDLLGALGIEDSAKARLFARSAFDQTTLIGDDAHRNSANPRITADDLSSEMPLKL